MNLIYRFSLQALLLASVVLTLSCGKTSVDPASIVNNNKDITATNSGINTIGGISGSANASTGATNTGGSTGTGSSTGTGGTTTGGSTGTNTGGTGTGTSTGSGGSSGSANTGNGGVAIGPANTIIFRIGNKETTLSAPNYFMFFDYPNSSPSTTNEIDIAAFDMTGGSFTLMMDNGKVGIQDLNFAAIQLGNPNYSWLTPTSSGKTAVTQFNYVSSSKGSIKGTFDMQMKAENGDMVRVVGSYNISM